MGFKPTCNKLNNSKVSYSSLLVMMDQYDVIEMIGVGSFGKVRYCFVMILMILITYDDDYDVIIIRYYDDKNIDLD